MRYLHHAEVFMQPVKWLPLKLTVDRFNGTIRKQGEWRLLLLVRHLVRRLV